MSPPCEPERHGTEERGSAPSMPRTPPRVDPDAEQRGQGRSQRGQVVRMGEAFGDRDDVAVDRGPAPEQAYSGQPS